MKAQEDRFATETHRLAALHTQQLHQLHQEHQHQEEQHQRQQHEQEVTWKRVCQEQQQQCMAEQSHAVKEAVQTALDTALHNAPPPPSPPTPRPTTHEQGTSTAVGRQDMEDLENAMCRALELSDQHQEKSDQLLRQVTTLQHALHDSHEAMEQETTALQQRIHQEQEKSSKYKSHATRVEQWFVENHKEEKKEWHDELLKTQQEHQDAVRRLKVSEVDKQTMGNNNVLLMEQLGAMCNRLEKECRTKQKERLMKTKMAVGKMDGGEMKNTIHSLQLAQIEMDKEKRKVKQLEKKNVELQHAIDSLVVSLR